MWCMLRDQSKNKAKQMRGARGAVARAYRTARGHLGRAFK